MFEVVVMEVDTREVQEVRIVTYKEAMAIANGYRNDPFYTVLLSAVQDRMKERKVIIMKQETIIELLESLIANSNESIAFAIEHRVPTDFFEGKLSAYQLVLDTIR